LPLQTLEEEKRSVTDKEGPQFKEKKRGASPLSKNGGNGPFERGFGTQPTKRKNKIPTEGPLLGGSIPAETLPYGFYVKIRNGRIWETA